MRRAALLLALLSSSALAARVEYRVVAGDTAYSLSRRFGVTVDALLTQNGLKAPDLKVGQVLLVDSPEAAATPAVPASATPAPTPPKSEPAPSLPPAPPAPAPTDTHTVEAGDTLYSIARSRGMTVEDVMKFNNMTTPDLQVGQVLQFTAPEAATTVSPTVPAAITPSVQPSKGAPSDSPTLVSLARSFLGVPYVYGGTTPRGLDCSGLVLQVMTPLGVSLPRTSAAMFSVGTEVSKGDIDVGDLVFFDTEGAGKVTHVGIALDHETFVHANSYNGKVTVDKLAEKYYATRYLGARRVLAGLLATGR